MRQKIPSSVSEDTASIYRVPAVDRAIRIMVMLSEDDRGMTLADVTQATGWHKSSVHKILITLDYHGFLQREEKTRRYTLGIELLKCGQSVLNNLRINNSAKIFLKELADFSGETAILAVLRGNKIVILDVVEPPGELRVSPPVGTIDSITTKSNGKAVLAWFPDDEVERFIEMEGLPAKTTNSITNATLYRKELSAVHEQGYAIDREEFQEGISAVSAPIFNSEGQVVGTVSLIGPSFRMKEDKMHLYGKKCIDAAPRLSPFIS